MVSGCSSLIPKVLSACLLQCVASNLQNPAVRPNFILINVDDMGWGDLGVHGEPNRDTPNIDKMALQGRLFTNFYTAAPLCSPSRAALLTGRLPVRNGFYTDNERGRNAYTPQEIVGGITNEVLISEVLRQSGSKYDTMLIGKWHLGHRPAYLPLEHGFKRWFGAPDCHFHYGNGTGSPNIPVYRNKSMVGRFYEKFAIDLETRESNYTQILKKEALRYIKKRASEANPFFLYFAPDSTHAPTYASKRFLKASKRGSRYGDSLLETDNVVGEILSTLTASGLGNRTLVIFTSDNGAALMSKIEGGSNGPFLCGKQTTFEGGFRTPAIFWWPGVIPPNTVSQQVGTQMDLFTTLATLGGGKIPGDRVIDGTDLTKALVSDVQTPRAVFYYRGNTLFAVRYGSYKLHLWTWTTPVSELKKGIDHCPDICILNVTTTGQTHHQQFPILYHLQRDPGERYPIQPTSPEYKKQVEPLKKLAQEHSENLVVGKPQLNWCDKAVMNWAPQGCENLNDCQKGPPSNPYKCIWDH